MTLIRNATCCLVATILFLNAKSQLYKIPIENKIDKASLIVEGRIIDQHSFWNPQHTIIYTSNIVQVYKLFKGKFLPKQIEVLTQGGTVGNQCLVVSDLLQLHKDEVGMFFCFENALQLHSPFTRNILYDVYSSAQGFLKYDLENDEAYAPFADYKNISQNLYSIISKRVGTTQKIVDASLKINSGNVSNGTGGTLGTITSFSPTTVHAGALNDPANNVLTINGSGFGNSPSGFAGVKFKDGNNDKTNPTFQIDYSSPYIISWSDTKIVLNVPDEAATGPIAVVLNDGTSVTSSTKLNVFFAVLNARFDPDQNSATKNDVIKEPRLMNTNGSGGYTYQFSTSTAGGGVNFATSPAKETFERAASTWREIVGANIKAGSTTTVQAIDDNDGVNVIVFDNTNTGVPPMAAGVLEATYSSFSACPKNANDVYTAQKTGFDILVRNNSISKGDNLPLEEGPCFPVLNANTFDLEMIILHELGHALNLAHINDDYEATSNDYRTVNPSAVMHYAILDYVDRRSPDAAAYQGALYTVTPQHNNYGSCAGGFTQEMSLLAFTPITNDECPSTFPATQIDSNTTVSFDLVHATSNKLNDPAFTQVNCYNTGTSVTNNAYYAFMNGSSTTLTLNISNYTLTPSQLSSCPGQSVRMALYDVASCPQGQSFPQPIGCSTFNKDGALTINNLQTSHKYLLYFDGLRNTKASFSVAFNGNGSGNPSTNPIVKLGPNPVSTGSITAQIENATGAFYQYALFDITGKMVATGKISVVQSTQTFTVYMNNLAAGVYVLRVADENGKTVSKSKILKL